MILYCGIRPSEHYPGPYAADAEQSVNALGTLDFDLVVWNWEFDIRQTPARIFHEQIILVSREKTLPLYEFAAAHGCKVVVAGPGQPSLDQTIAEIQEQIRTARQNESYRSLFAKYGGHLKLHLWHDLIVEGHYSNLIEDRSYRLILLEPVEEAAPKPLLEGPRGTDSHRIIAEIFPEASVILALQAQWEGIVFYGRVSRIEERANRCKEELAAGINTQRRLWISPALSPEQIHDFYMETINEAIRRKKRQKQHAVSRLVSGYVETHLGEKLTRKTISNALFFSPDYLAKVFQQETGMTLGSYIYQTRLRRAKDQLTETNLPIGVIASQLGYQNFSEFSQWFRKSTGMTPSQYRKNGRIPD